MTHTVALRFPTRPAPIAVEWVCLETAAARLGVLESEIPRMVADGLLRGKVERLGAHLSERWYPARLWVSHADVIDLADRAADYRSGDPLAAYERREWPGTIVLKPLRHLRAADTRIGRMIPRGSASPWPDSADGTNLNHPERRRQAPYRPARYGLLNLSDVAELQRRRCLWELRRRSFPLPVIPGPAACPDCRRADLIELHTRRQAARVCPC